MTIGPGDAIGGRVFAEISKDLSQTKTSSNIQMGWAIRPSLNTFDEIPKPSVFLSLFNISNQDNWQPEPCNIVRNC